MSETKQISLFDDVVISQNTLIICDIDDTILWLELMKKTLEKNKWNKSEMTGQGYNRAEWIAYISSNIPSHTDEKGFIKLLERVRETDSRIMFVTARGSYLRDVTLSHFNSLKLEQIDFEKDVYHIGGQQKGDFIVQNAEFKKYDNVVFIDDLDSHINNVKDHIESLCKLTCYKFTCNATTTST